MRIHHAFLVMVMILVAAEVSTGETKPITLSVPGKKFAVDSSTGAMAVINAKGNSVSLYPNISSQENVSGRIDCNFTNNPKDIVFKAVGDKTYFLVLCDNTLYVLNAQSLAKEHEIALSGAPRSISAPSRANVPFAYYGSDKSFGRANLQAFSDEGPLMERDRSFESICSSSDGKLLYGRTVTSSPVVVVGMTIRETAEKPMIEQAFHLAADHAAFVADPHGPYVHYSTQSRSKTEHTPDCAFDDIPGNVLGIMATRPLVFAKTQDAIHVYSANSHKEVASFLAPQIDRNVMLIDEKNGNLLLPGEYDVEVIHLASAHLPDEPVLGVELEGDTTLVAENSAKFAVEKLTPDETIAIQNRPKELTLDGNSINWTPKLKDIGRVTFQVVSKGKNIERVQDFAVDIQRAQIVLPFVPIESTISADGKWMAVLGQLDSDARDGKPCGSKIILLDLDAGKIVSNWDLQTPSNTIAVDEHGVYACQQAKDVIDAYSVKDPASHHRAVTTGHITSMTAAHGKLYALSVARVTEYALPDLGSAKVLDLSMAASEISRSEFDQVPVQTGGRWEYRGAVLDEKMASILKIRRASDLFQVGDQQGVYGSDFRAGLLEQWGTTPLENPPPPDPAMRAGTAMNQPAIVLATVPATAHLHAEKPMDIGGMVSIKISALAGNGQDEIGLMQQSYWSQQPPRVSTLFSAGGKLVAVAHDRLFILNESSLDRTKYPLPPAILPSPGVPALSESGPTVITFDTPGMKAPVTYTVSCDFVGLNEESKGNRVLIDGKKLMNQAADDMANQFKFHRQSMHSTTTMENYVKSYHISADSAFKAIVGKLPTGIPVALPISVTACDSDKHTATGEFVAFLDIPISTLTPRLRDGYIPKSPPAIDPHLTDLRNELKTLQKEQVELEAQNKLLKELLKDDK